MVINMIFIDRLVFPVPETALNSTSPGAERRYPNNMMYIVGNAACTTPDYWYISAIIR